MEETTAPVAPEQAASSANIHFTEILNDSWQLFQKKFWNLLGIYLMMTVIGALVVLAGIIVGGLVVLITLIAKVPALTVVVAAAAILGVIGLALWAFTWMVVAILKYLDSEGHESVKDAIMHAKPLAYPLLPTIIVSILATLGGYVLFIIPGIILSITLGFVSVVAALENKKMWEAMQTSRRLVKGHWWKILGLYIVLAIVIFVAIMATGGTYSPLVLFLSPLTYTISYVLYKKLDSRTHKPELADNTWFYKLTTALGILLIVGGIITGAAIAGTNWDKFKANLDKGFQEERNSQQDGQFDMYYEYSPEQGFDEGGDLNIELQD